MKKTRFIVLLLMTAIFSVAIIPVMINETYKFGANGTGYVTMWSAADAISYYGTLLGAVATILALMATICFTKKQIQRDRFLELNYVKWNKVESIITQTLFDISPLKMCNFEKLNGSISDNLSTVISNLLQYESTAKTSLNIIKCYIDPCDYEKISKYVTELHNAIIQFCDIGTELLDEYMALQTSALRNSGVIPDAELLAHLDRTTEINKRIPLAHDITYQRLLNMKRDAFETIYMEI